MTKQVTGYTWLHVTCIIPHARVCERYTELRVTMCNRNPTTRKQASALLTYLGDVIMFHMSNKMVPMVRFLRGVASVGVDKRVRAVRPKIQKTKPKNSGVKP